MAARTKDPQQPDAFDDVNLGNEDFSADERKVRAGFWRKFAPERRNAGSSPICSSSCHGTAFPCCICGKTKTASATSGWRA